MVEKSFEHGALKAGFSGAVALAWLVFIILFLAFPELFNAEAYPANKIIAVILLSVLVLALLLGGLWAYWSLVMMSKKDWEIFQVKGFKWRIIGTIIYGLVLLVILIYGFWYLWTDFRFWQYLAIILIVLIISGGLMGLVWASWSAKNKEEMEKRGQELGKKFEKGFQDSFGKKEEKNN